MEEFNATSYKGAALDHIEASEGGATYATLSESLNLSEGETKAVLFELKKDGAIYMRDHNEAGTQVTRIFTESC